MNRIATSLVAASLLLAARAAQAQGKDPLADKKFRLVLNGAFSTGSLSFSESRPFREYAEASTLEAQYEAKSGPGFDLSLQYNVVRHVGVQAGFSGSSRDSSGTFSAALPHPFFFNQPRRVSGDLDGLKYKDTAFHGDLVFTGASGPLEFTFFGGVSFFNVDADVVDKINYNQTYPYDTVTVTSVPTKTVSDSPTGWNLGGRLDYGFGSSRRFGIAIQARYSKATVKLVPTEGSTVSLDAGGLLASAGVRIAF